MRKRIIIILALIVATNLFSQQVNTFPIRRRLRVYGTTKLDSALTVSDTVTANAYVGDGSALTGIASGTGGVENAGSTTVGADSNSNGSGEIAFQIGKTTEIRIKNSGYLGIGPNESDPDSSLSVELGTEIKRGLAVGEDLTVGGDVSITGTLSPFVYDSDNTLSVNSQTPSISGGTVFKTANTSSTAITQFSGDPGANEFKRIWILIQDDLTTFTHDGTNIETGGVSLAPDSADVVVFDIFGTKAYGEIAHIR